MMSLGFFASALLVVKSILCVTGVVPRIIPDPISLVVSEDPAPAATQLRAQQAAAVLRPAAMVHKTVHPVPVPARKAKAAQPVRIVAPAVTPDVVTLTSAAPAAPRFPASAAGPFHAGLCGG